MKKAAYSFVNMAVGILIIFVIGSISLVGVIFIERSRQSEPSALMTKNIVLPNETISRLVVNNDMTLFAVASQDTHPVTTTAYLRIFPFGAAEPLFTFAVEVAIRALSIAPDGAYVAATLDDGRVLLFAQDVSGFHLQQVFPSHIDTCIRTALRTYEFAGATAFAPQGDWIAMSCRAGRVFMPSLKTRDTPMLLDSAIPKDSVAIQKPDIIDVVFHEDGTLLAAVRADYQVDVWDLTTRTITTSFHLSTANFLAYRATFCTDSEALLITEQLGNAQLWSLAQARLITRYEFPVSQLIEAVSADCHTIVGRPLPVLPGLRSNTENAIYLHSIIGNRIDTVFLTNPTGVVTSVALSRDAQWMLTGDQQGVVALWAIRSE